MNITKETDLSRLHRSINNTCLGAIAMFVVGTQSGQATAADQAKYDENVLFNPSKAVLLAEQRGRVTIYDALEHRVIDEAMDTQFDRIGSMMFVRTRDTLPDGAGESDDDC